jgi:hypothetical protein
MIRKLGPRWPDCAAQGRPPADEVRPLAIFCWALLQG